MKRSIMFLLVLATSTGPLFAQFADETKLKQQVDEYRALSRTEKTFRMGPWWDRKKFHFQLENGNQISFYFINLDQVKFVPDVDSLLRIVWKSLGSFQETFSKPLTTRRVDYNFELQDQRVRLVEYEPTSQVYRLKGNDTAQLKMEQDTLNLRLLANYKYSGKQDIIQPYYITLLLNNITDLQNIKKEDLDWIVQTLKAEAKEMLDRSKNARFKAVAMNFNVAQRRKFESAVSPKKLDWFLPYAQGSFQYVRGAWSPSVGLGVEYTWRQYNLQTSYFRLMWEPYFFFTRTTDKKTEVDRTDFISLVYGERLFLEAGGRDLRYGVHFSIGYAVRNKGDWFEENAFKFSFPGLEYRNMYLYPEFHANKLFKNVSPSLKLVVNME